MQFCIYYCAQQIDYIKTVHVRCVKKSDSMLDGGQIYIDAECALIKSDLINSNHVLQYKFKWRCVHDTLINLYKIEFEKSFYAIFL